MSLRVKPRRRFFVHRLWQILADCRRRGVFIRRLRRLRRLGRPLACASARRRFCPQIKADSRRLPPPGVFYPQITQISADFWGYPQIPQISADYGGLSWRCASKPRRGFRRLGRFSQIAAAGGVFIRRFRRLAQIFGGYRRLRRLTDFWGIRDSAISADYGGLSCRCARKATPPVFVHRLWQILADCRRRFPAFRIHACVHNQTSCLTPPVLQVAWQ